jgi:hypothetical protein
MSEAVRKIKRVLEVDISGIAGVFLKAIKKYVPPPLDFRAEMG